MITDRQARNIVINKLDKNIYTNASAGAGKTTSLTNRIVALIESGVDISSICTITFTKAAANEFYERLQELLSIRSKPDVIDKGGFLKTTDEDSAALCQKALQNIDLCFMGTIDSFTNKIVNEHPLENGVPACTTICDDEKLNVFLNELYYDIFDGVYDKEYPELIKLRSDYIRCIDKPRDSFINNIKPILDKRYAKLVYNKVDAIQEKSKEVIKWYATTFIDAIDGHRDLFADGQTKSFEKAILIRRKVAYSFDTYINSVSSFISNITDVKPNCQKCDELKISGIMNEYLERPEKVSSRSVYKHLILDDIDKEVKGYILSIGARFLEIAKEIAAPKLTKEGLLTYSGFLITLRNTLKEDISKDHKIIDHIANKYKYFLLDESQDTSPLQTQIFFYINARNYDVDWKKCNPRPGSIFIVGDPKQSIYRFNGADVSAYMETEKLFYKINELGEMENYDNIAVTLTKNYRSCLSLREWFNEQFRSLLKPEDNNPIHDDIDISDPLKAHECDASFNGAYTYETKPKEYYIDVVSIIKTIVNNENYKIVAKKDDTPRTIDYSDIMIITKTKKFNNIIEQLDANNIPYCAEGRTLFENNELINTLKTLFKLTVKPTNNEYLYKALLTKYCNLNDNDIVSITNNYAFSIINYEYNTKLSEKVNNELLKLSKLYDSTKDLSYSSKFEYLLNSIEIFKYIDIDNLDLAYYTLEIIRTAEKDNALTSDIIAIEFIDNINSDNRNYERSLKLNTARNAVKLANAHKVKGLQAPVVILSWQIDKDDPAEYRLGFNPEETYEPFKLCGKSIKNEHSEEEKNELISEKKRLAYVAATRAEAVLIILYCRKEEKSNKSGDSFAKSVWNGLYSSTLPTFEFIDNQADEVDDKPKEIVDDVNDLYNQKTCVNDDAKEKSYTLVKPSELKKVSKAKIIEDDTIEVDHSTYTNNVSDYALLGTIVHRMMELIANSRNIMDLDCIVSTISKEYMLDDSIKLLLEKAYKTIQNGGFKQNGGYYVDDILNEIINAKTVLCEVPFAYYEESKLYNGVMDIVYEDKNGNWHIIDYKTTFEMSIKELENEYEKQLDNYKKALKEISGIDADAHIYHIDIHH